ncbi:MAG: carboxypeptidase regulatory-like domain-containing protein [Acidobacteria bacterium]|nr:carboxypeptidase regulatory-like domain-containing protein [Acidobacteriota bacterium]
MAKPDSIRKRWFLLSTVVVITAAAACGMKMLREFDAENAGRAHEMDQVGGSHRGSRGARLIFDDEVGVKSVIASLTRRVPVERQDGDTYRTKGVELVLPTHFDGDVRDLPPVASEADHIEPELEGPNAKRFLRPNSSDLVAQMPEENVTSGPMPGPVKNFQGLFRGDSVTGGAAGNGTPPDVNGDVGLDLYIQSVNSSYAIFSKSGTRLAAFTENSLWSVAGTGTLCDTTHRGDPVAIYDQFADRWILTDFAFSGTGSAAPFYQCFAVSKSSDPVAGGWWFYAVRVDDASHVWLNDYPKFGNWNDGCLYMSANEFSTGGSFRGTLFASFNKAAMESGAPLNTTNASIGYISNTSDPYSMMPSNISGAKLAKFLPPAGTPNYFVSESQTSFAFEVRKFTPGSGCGGGGTLAAPVNVSQASYTYPGGSTDDNIVPQPGSILLDTLGDRVMQRAQYRRIGSSESIWITHTFQTSANNPTGSQWAQIDVTGGTVATTPVQQQKYDPADGLWRWMSSIAADRDGNVALVYNTSNASTNPSIAYSGRLAGDPANSMPQNETQLIAGVGSQTGNCGGLPCHRWGDYASISIDPSDDCTFWVTSEYYPANAASSVAWGTQIGAFRFPSCTLTPTATGVTISGRVLTPSGQGLRNAVVSLTGPGGVTRQVRTGSLGYYEFTDVTVGASYVLSVSSNRYTFTPKFITVNDEIAGLNLTAD